MNTRLLLTVVLGPLVGSLVGCSGGDEGMTETGVTQVPVTGPANVGPNIVTPITPAAPAAPPIIIADNPVAPIAQ